MSAMYRTLESALDLHAEHPVLSPTYNPTLLARAPALYADIAHLLDIPTSSLHTHPSFHSLLSKPPRALREYTSRLHDLVAAPNPAPLLAHAYVRYLGDLSGGQVIRRRIAHAYALDGDAGTQFYQFQRLGGGGAAALGDMKRIKEWYRDGMNTGVGDDRDLKGQSRSLRILFPRAPADCCTRAQSLSSPRRTRRSSSTLASSSRSRRRRPRSRRQ
jgi:heme oxygenase (biliverdin-producing, ferredoxin)